MLNSNGMTAVSVIPQRNPPAVGSNSFNRRSQWRSSKAPKVSNFSHGHPDATLRPTPDVHSVQQSIMICEREFDTLCGIITVNVLRFGWVTLLLVASAANAADVAYTAEIHKWRQDFDADVRNGGWLTGIGNFEIPPGSSTLGSSPTSSIRLAPVHAAKSIGKLVRRGDVVTFSPFPGIHASIDSRTISHPHILSMQSDIGKVRVGSIEFRVRHFAEAIYVFVDDLENPAVAEFAGNKWFAIDDSYRISAKFVPYGKPAETRVPMTHIGWKKPMTSTGDVVFSYGGQSYRLKSFIDDDNLFIMFSDLTNGRETYGGGRFIDHFRRMVRPSSISIRLSIRTAH
jgi:uncharacterized protein